MENSCSLDIFPLWQNQSQSRSQRGGGAARRQRTVLMPLLRLTFQLPWHIMGESGSGGGWEYPRAGFLAASPSLSLRF